MNGVYIQFWPTLLILKQIILTCTHLSQCKSSIVYSSEPVQEQHCSRVWARSRAALFTRLSPFKSSIVYSSEPVQEQHCYSSEPVQKQHCVHVVWLHRMPDLHTPAIKYQRMVILCGACADTCSSCDIATQKYTWHRYTKTHVTSLVPVVFQHPCPSLLPLVTCLLVFSLKIHHSQLLRGSGCTVNDLWDRDLDRKVRPVTFEEITFRHALFHPLLQIDVTSSSHSSMVVY